MAGEKGSGGWMEWFGLRLEPDFTKARWLGRIIGLVLVLAAAATVLGGLAVLVRFLGLVLGVTEMTGTTAIRDYGFIVAFLLGAPFVIWRALVAQKQADTAEQSSITDRINKAVEGLGADKTVTARVRTVTYTLDDQRHQDIEWEDRPLTIPDIATVVDTGHWESGNRTDPNLEVRIGAIYALERLSRDSPRDHLQIMESLCGYVRGNAPALSLEPTDGDFDRPQPRVDIQTAITVIGRRSAEARATEESSRFRLDLRYSDLSGVDFRNGNFSAAMFHYSRIEAAWFRRSVLCGSQFFNSLLNHTDFFEADLKGASFDYCTINRPTVPAGGFNCPFISANMRGVSFAGADLTGVTYIGDTKLMNSTFGTKDTRLSYDMDDERGDLRERRNAFDLAMAREAKEEIAAAIASLEEIGFRHWPIYDASDGATTFLKKEFLKELRLIDWPIVENPSAFR